MNIIDLLRGANPAAAGAAITGYGDPNAMSGPVAPVRPPQASIDALQGQNFQPEGSVLAVIDPALRARQQEEQGLLQRASDSLTSGGLTADGKGRSKWGAFAHGLATGLNAQGERRTKAEQAKYDRAFKEREMANKEKSTSQLGDYYKTLGNVAQRKQNWQETPDDPTTTGPGGIGELRLEDRRLRWRVQRARELGVSFREDALSSDDQRAARVRALQQLDAEERDPNHIWNRARAPAPAAATATPPTAAPAVDPMPSGPVSSSAPPAPQAAAPAAPTPAPQAAPAPQIREGQRARNPQTGAVLEFKGGAWVPAQ